MNVTLPNGQTVTASWSMGDIKIALQKSLHDTVTAIWEEPAPAPGVKVYYVKTVNSGNFSVQVQNG